MRYFFKSYIKNIFFVFSAIVIMASSLPVSAGGYYRNFEKEIEELYNNLRSAVIKNMVLLHVCEKRLPPGLDYDKIAQSVVDAQYNLGISKENIKSFTLGVFDKIKNMPDEELNFLNKIQDEELKKYACRRRIEDSQRDLEYVLADAERLEVIKMVMSKRPM